MDEFAFVGSDEEPEVDDQSSSAKASSSATSSSGRRSVTSSRSSMSSSLSTLSSSIVPTRQSPSASTHSSVTTASSRSNPSGNDSKTSSLSTMKTTLRGRTKSQRRMLRRLQGELSDEEQDDNSQARTSSTGEASSSSASRTVRFSMNSQVSRPSSTSAASSQPEETQKNPIMRSESPKQLDQPSDAPSPTRPAQRFRARQERLAGLSSARKKKDEDDDDYSLDMSVGRKRNRVRKNLGKTYNGAVTLARQPGPALSRMDDSFAFLDPGNAQFLLDQCHYFCSTLRDRSTPTSTLLETAVQWVQMLSNKKDRQVLVQDEASLHSILDVVGCAQNFIDTKVANSAPSSSLSSPQKTSPFQGFDGEEQHPLVQAIAIALHFVSLDCTLSEKAAVPLKGARSVRKALLSHPRALQGIMHLILADPVVLKLIPPGDRENPSADAFDYEDDLSTPDIGSQSSVASSAASTAFGTPDSQSSGGSVDSTKAGRRRKRKKAASGSALATIQEASGEDVSDKKKSQKRAERLSFSSEPSTPPSDRPLEGMGESLRFSKACDQLESLSLRHHISDCIPATTKMSTGAKHPCGFEPSSNVSAVALVFLKRILSGKMEGTENSCLNDDDEEDDATGGERVPSSDEAMDALESNPLFVTNRLLGESGAVELLAQALAEALAALAHLLRDSKDECQTCLACLHDRIATLGSLIDNASLFYDGNRKLLSQSGYTTEFQGFLIVGLVTMLRIILNQEERWEGILGDIALSILRTLTSLTHENASAAKELTVPVALKQCGLDVVALVFWQAAQLSSGKSLTAGSDNKAAVPYDAKVFCLNTLTNAVESHCPRSHFAKLETPDGRSMMGWLTEWLVQQMSTSFRQAVTESTFESLEDGNKHADHELTPQESESLVVAGSGFVLVACLLIASTTAATTTASSVAGTKEDGLRNALLQSLPGERFNSKVVFVINTLKAFCNFYHHTVGGLSVAVVAPVRSVIEKLEGLSE